MKRNSFFHRMLRKARKFTVVKHLFFCLLLLCIIVVIYLLYISDTFSLAVNGNLDDLNYAKLPLLQFSEDMLSTNFEDCFMPHFLDFFGNNSNQSRTEFFSLENIRNISNNKENMYIVTTILEFSELARELEIQTFLIEPAILFCILSPALQTLLSKRKCTFENSKYESVITMGVLQKYVLMFEKEYVKDHFVTSGFQIDIIKSPILTWMNYNSSLFTSHVFIKKDKWTIHLVVFHPRNNYLWHASLLSQSKFTQKESLHFVDDSAYDNFSTVSLGFKHPVLNNINIPTRPANFLYQIKSSRFLECNKTIVDRFMKLPTSTLPSVHSSLSVKHFNERFIIALDELKQKLDPLLIDFWIWSGTMLGWYRQCDVIPYTSDVDFGAWASDIEDLDQLMKLFIKNEHLEMKQKMGTVDEGLEFNLNCHGLRVDLFFSYKSDNGTWYAGHRPSVGIYFRYHHPNFSLCSAELLGQKVLVPCETENVIFAEYGTDWLHPVSSWSYERSAKNIGPNIFWEKSILKKVYVDF